MKEPLNQAVDANSGANASQPNDSTSNSTATGQASDPDTNTATNGSPQSPVASSTDNGASPGNAPGEVNGLADRTKSPDRTVGLDKDAAGLSSESDQAEVKGPHDSKKPRKDRNRVGSSEEATATLVAIASTATDPVAVAPVGSRASQSTSSTKIFATRDDNAPGMAFNVADKQADASGMQSGLSAAIGNRTPTAHVAIKTSANAAEAAANAADTVANMSTSTSSIDLLLNSTAGAASPTDAPADPAAIQIAAVSGNTVSDDVLSTAGAELTGNASVRMFQSSGAQSGASSVMATLSAAWVPPRTDATEHSESSGTQAPTNPPGVQSAPELGNIESCHTSIGVATSSGPPNAGGSQPSLTPSMTFAAMDRAGSGTGQILLHAAPNQVAIGMTDPGLGWIEVRAERVAGQVTAALTANSTTSHSELISVLPAMSNYLHDLHQVVQQIHVETGLVGQNPTGSQENPTGRHHRGRAGAEPMEAVTGIGATSRAVSTQAIRAELRAEGLSQRSSLEGHQFSVRA